MTSHVTNPQAAALDRLNECVPRIAAAEPTYVILPDAPVVVN